MGREGSCLQSKCWEKWVVKADARKSGEQAFNMLNTLPRASAGLPQHSHARPNIGMLRSTCMARTSGANAAAPQSPARLT